jgi:tetratricopeptide (TPR) repeat protein
MTLPSPPALVGIPESLEVIERIHRGSERSIYRVRERAGGGTWVLKIVHGDASGEAKQAIDEEFLLLQRLKHPHLVRVSRFLHLTDGSRGFLAEDLEQAGPNPSDLGEWSPRDPEAARSILGALGSLHAIGYAHLDLKPSQVLRGPRGLVLIDLGLAAPIGSRVAPRGTWGFIAPELLSQGEWDRRVDFYGLGSLLVYVWTGVTPLGEGEIVEQIRRQQRRPRLRLRERVPGLPEGLDRVVEGLLDPDPAKRPPDAASAWESIHTMAGARERYLERRRLPVPDEMPLAIPEEIEREWDHAVISRAGQPWVIEGPPGSGRHRLLERLRARTQVLGAACELSDEALHVLFVKEGGCSDRALACRVGRAQVGEKRVELGAVGPTQSAAALEAYGLPAEGNEEAWTFALLQARLDERVGGEEARRRSGRIRRMLAAADGSRIPAAARPRLARTLVAATRDEAPSADEGDLLLDGGWLRRGADGRLTPATPPWDRQALMVLAGEVDLQAAHRDLLASSGSNLVSAAKHALGARDRQSLLSSLPAAVDRLREGGDLATAIELLSGSQEILGASFPPGLLVVLAGLVLEDGSPSRCLALLRVREPSLPGEWKTLVEAHLHNRAGRRQEAIAAARPLMLGQAPGSIRRAAAAIVVRAMTTLGGADEVLSVAGDLLRDPDPAIPAPERLRLAHLLHTYLSLRGGEGKTYRSAQLVCQECLEGPNPRARLVAAGALGNEAFRRGDLKGARVYFEAVHRDAEELGDLLELTGARVNLGGIYFEEGQLSESESLGRLCLESYGQLRMFEHVAFARRNLAAILMYSGRLGEALHSCRAARQELASLNAKADAASAVGLEVGIQTDAGLLHAAEATASEASRLLAELPDDVVETILWRDRGRIFRCQGDPARARDLLGRSLETARRAGAVDEECRTLLEWATAEAASGEIGRAQGHLDETTGKLDDGGGGELAVRRGFCRSAILASGGREDAIRASDLLARTVTISATSGLRLWTWRCHAAMAGLAARVEDGARTLIATRAAREALRDLLEAIGTVALQESYVMLPDPRVFLAWCEHDASAREEIPLGTSDLEVFLR